MSKSTTQRREEAKAQSFPDFMAGVAMAVAKSAAALLAMFAIGNREKHNPKMPSIQLVR